MVVNITSGGIEKGTWVKILNPDGRVNAETLLGILTDAAGKNSWNLETGVMSLDGGTTIGGKTLDENVNALLPDVDASIKDALDVYDEGLDQAKVLEKLQSGDTGLYLGDDGLLHMLPERVITDGANIAVCYLPTTILDGKVTSYREARIVNGIIYLPETGSEGDVTDTGNTDGGEN